MQKTTSGLASKVNKVCPQLIVALDNHNPDEARQLAQELTGAGVRWVKVGLELFVLSGPKIIEELKQIGFSVFLDLKLYDIPNTVSQTVKAAAATGADLLTLHCSGGQAMLEAAKNVADGTSLALLGVTVLTSFGDQDFYSISYAWGAREGIVVPRSTVVLKLAEFASKAGLSGIVCSANDLHDKKIQTLSWQTPNPFYVTPGIRERADSSHDQRVVSTVEQAVTAGSTHLVVGRPITAHPPGQRLRAAREFLMRIEKTYGISTHS